MARYIAGWLLVLTIAPFAAPLTATAEEEAISSSRFSNMFSYLKPDPEPLLGDRLNIKLGYKVWVAKWQTPQTSVGTGSIQLNADHPGILHGPTITGTYKLREGAWFNSMFVTATTMRDGFDFGGTSGQAHLNHFAVRRDTNVSVGLAIWEGFGLFAGYYRSDQRFLGNQQLPSSSGTYSTRTLDGPIFGLFGNVPVSERFSLYGNAAWAVLKFDTNFPNTSLISSTNSDTHSAQGQAIEVGVNVAGPRVWKVGTVLQLGFRQQTITKTFGRNPAAGRTDDLVFNDITWGPTFSINAVF